ncbi:MAG: hypothetical protein AAB594_02735 [Patescibacteria group bacterium]
MKLIIFGLINLLPFLVLEISSRGFSNYSNPNSEANLFVIPKNVKYDLVILGTSHAREFSNGDNHQVVQAMLGKSFLNLSKSLAGVLPQKFYLSYFFKEKNKTEKILYFIDPFVLYSIDANEERLFNDEPFRMDVLWGLAENGFSKTVIYNYLKSNISRLKINPLAWLPFEPNLGTKNKYRAGGDFKPIDVKLLDQTVGNYYNGLDEQEFSKSALRLKNIIELAEQHQARMVFVIPPTQWRIDPGKEDAKKLMFDLKEKHQVEFHDLSESVKNPKFYKDSDHLNKDGVVYFTERFLKPILNK